MDNLPEQDNGPNPFFADGEIPDSVAEESGLKHRLVFDARLSEGLGFTEDDLAANRAGEMTEEQKQSFGTSPWETLAMMIAIIIFLAFMVISGLLAQGTPIPNWWAGVVCCLLPFAFVATFIFATMDKRFKYVLPEKPSGNINSLTGAVFPHEHTNGKIVINNHELRMPTVPGPIFVEGDHYVVYYERETKYVVAAERIDYE